MAGHCRMCHPWPVNAPEECPCRCHRPATPPAAPKLDRHTIERCIEECEREATDLRNHDRGRMMAAYLCSRLRAMLPAKDEEDGR